MSLFKIAWRSLQRRALASSLTTLSMALGVMLVVAVLLIHGIVEESFRSNSSLGYNIIVGAKGGKLQLVLNTVYYLSQPVENIPYAYYQEWLGADEIDQYRNAVGIDELGEVRDGKFKMFTKFAIPVCLGDYFGQHRVVGTIPQLFDDYVYDLGRGKIYEFAEGRNFRINDEENGYFECVVGSRVRHDDARISLGQELTAAHGDPEGEMHDEHPFIVVGILRSTGTPVDRAVFVNMEGFYLMDGHAKPLDDPEPAGDDVAAVTDGEGDIGGTEPAAETPPSEAERMALIVQHRFDPITVPEREVTAILISSVNQLVTPGLTNTVNEGRDAQAVLPIAEIYSLFEVIVKPIQRVLLVITVLICIVSGVSILVSIYNSMSDRRHEIAVMRALGAGRRTVMSIVLLESIFLALGGGVLGWVAGHVMIGLASGEIEARTGVSIGIAQLTPGPNLDEYANLDGLIATINKVRESVGWAPIQHVNISTELMLIPSLILLAVIVGFLPAMSAYQTDVARAMSAAP